MKYKIERVTTKKQLQKLYDNSAFTIEGLAEKSIPDLLDWLSKNTTFTTEEPVVFITKGDIMNMEYGLTGSYAYPEDLTIVSVIDIDQLKIALIRFSVGARWFDDIVDNNKNKELS